MGTRGQSISTNVFQSRRSATNPQGTERLLKVRTRKYDEARIVLRSTFDSDDELAEDLGPTKCIVVESGFLAVHGFQHGPTCVRAKLPWTMSAVDNQTAEALRVVIDTSLKLYDSLSDVSYARNLDYIVVDEHKSNIKVERSIAHENPGTAHFLHLCSIHKADACSAKALAEQKALVAGCRHVALALRPGGSMSKMRRTLRGIIREKLQVTFEASSLDASAYMSDALDLFLPSTSRENLVRRSGLELLVNGDWRRYDVVQHIERGCCASPEDTLQKFEKFLPRLLLSKVIIWPSKSWTSGHKALSAIGLPMACHGLMSACVTALWGSTLIKEPAADGEVEPPDDPGADEDGARPEASAAAEVLDAAALVAEERGEQGDAPPVDATKDYAEKLQSYRKSACEFLCDSGTLTRMVVVRRAMQPQISMMFAYLD